MSRPIILQNEGEIKGLELGFPEPIELPDLGMVHSARIQTSGKETATIGRDLKFEYEAKFGEGQIVLNPDQEAEMITIPLVRGEISEKGKVTEVPDSIDNIEIVPKKTDISFEGTVMLPAGSSLQTAKITLKIVKGEVVDLSVD